MFVIVDRRTGKPVLETFSAAVAGKVNAKAYEVVEIADWLARVNRTIKSGRNAPDCHIFTA